MRRRYLPDEVVEQRHPIAYLSVALIGLVAAFIVRGLVWQTTLWIGLVLLAMVSSVVSARRQAKMEGILCLFVLLSCLPLLIDHTEGREPILRLYDDIGVSQSSLSTYLHVALRCMGASSASLLIVYTIPIYQLSRMLKRLGLPQLLIELFDLTYRYIFILLDVADNLFIAMKSRFAFERRKDLIPHSAMLLGRTMLLAYNDAEREWYGLLSRQYDELANTNDQSSHHVARSAVGSTYTDDRRDTTEYEYTEHDNHPLYELRDVSFVYENSNEPTLSGINLRLHPREVVYLDGDNGAGKSTLFYILAGIVRPSHGQYLFEGRELRDKRSDLRTLRRSVGLVLQNSNHQLFTPSVEDEIAFGLNNLGMDKTQTAARVNAVIEEFDLQSIRHRPPHLLSEGQKKWVALAAVLALQPRLVILDEPTAGLDKAHTERIPALISKLLRQGTTILLASHDQSILAHLPIRRLMIADGKIRP